MKKLLSTILITSGMASMAYAATTMTAKSNPIKPVDKVYNIKCDKSTDGVIVKKMGLNIPAMICSTKQGGWVSAESAFNMMKNKNDKCMQNFDQMKNEHDNLIAAIKTNDPNKVGLMVIKMHQEQDAFFESNPDCSFKKMHKNSASATIAK